MDIVNASDVLRVVFPVLSLEPAAPASPNHKVNVILQGAEPRWIMVGDPAKALPVLRSWQPFKLQSRLKWSLVLLACSMDALSRLPGTTNQFSSFDLAYWQRRLPNFSQDWTAVIHVGNASHTRKAILFLVDKNAVVTAVAKIPLTSEAAGAILNEATILEHLASRGDLPHVLFQDCERGIAAQSWLEGKAVSRAFTQAHVELLSRLHQPQETIRLTDCREPLTSSLDKLDLPFSRARLNQALELIDGKGELPAFVEHRDFAPWNLKRLGNGRLTLLDWEWAVEKSLPWQDVCRYFYIQDLLFCGPGKVWQALLHNSLLTGYLRRFAIPYSAIPGLTMHYLLRTLCIDSNNQDIPAATYAMRQIELVLDSSELAAARS